MQRIDKLLIKVIPKPTPLQKLEQDNIYLGKSCNELLDYLSGDSYRAPDMRTTEWDKFIYAVIQAKSVKGMRGG